MQTSKCSWHTLLALALTAGVLLGWFVPARTLAAAAAAAASAAPRPAPEIVRGFVGGLGEAPLMKDWGANVVRMFLGPRSQQDVGKQLEAVRALGGFKVVVTHSGPGGPGGTTQWGQPEFEEAQVRFWKETASRLLPYRDVIWGYDLFNEPLDRRQLPLPPREWRGLAVKIVEAIRSVDDRAWIIYEVGPGGMFAGFKNLVPLPDKRVIYSAHYYFPHEFTHAGVRTTAGTPLTEIMKSINVPYPVKSSELKRSQWEMDILQKPPMNIPAEKCVEWNKDLQRLYMAPAVEFQQKYQVPIYIGEFSAVSWAPVDSLVRYLSEAIELFEEYGWSWSYHSFGGYPGWNPQMPEGPEHYVELQTNPKPSELETCRMKLLKEALKKNR